MDYKLYFADNIEDLDADEFWQACENDTLEHCCIEEWKGNTDQEVIHHLLAQAFCRGWSLMDDYAAVIVKIDGAGSQRIWSGNCTDPDLVKAYNALLTNNNN